MHDIIRLAEQPPEEDQQLKALIQKVPKSTSLIGHKLYKLSGIIETNIFLRQVTQAFRVH